MSIWRFREYRRWLALDTSHEFASAIKRFSFPMLALIATGDPLLAGLVGTFGVLAEAVAGLVGGHLADHHSKLSLMILASLAGAVLSAIWWVCFAFDIGLAIPLLLTGSVLLSMRYGLVGSASTGLLVETLDERVIGRALAANQGRDATISLTGAPLGGLILGISTALVAPLLVLLDLLGLAAGLLMRRLPQQTSSGDQQSAATPPEQPAEDDDGAAESFLSRAAAGFRWLFSRADALGAVAVGSLLSIGLGLILTAQIYSLQQQGTPVGVIGLVSSALGVGMLAGSLLSGRILPRIPGGKLMLFIGASQCLLCLGLIPSTEIWQIMLLLGLLALGVPVYNAAGMGYLLLAIPGNLIGRVGSAAGLINIGAASLPPVVVGALLPTWGRSGLCWLALAVLCAAVLVVLLNRTLRGIPKPEDLKEYAANRVTREAPRREPSGATTS